MISMYVQKFYSFSEQATKSELKLCLREREIARGFRRFIQSIALSFFLENISVVAFRYEADSWLSSVKISSRSGSALLSPFDLMLSIIECIASTIWSLHTSPGDIFVLTIKSRICSSACKYKIPKILVIIVKRKFSEMYKHEDFASYRYAGMDGKTLSPHS